VGKVISIFICPKAALPMKEVREVRAIAGAGLEGDRYARGEGAWSRSSPGKVRHVSLIAVEAISASNRNGGGPMFLASETRRNIVTEGVDLNDLVGKEFRVAGVRMRGTEPCDPCVRPTVLSRKTGFRERFKNRGGLRAEILSDGVIRAGDDIET
jgi:MOSC domain-containing protein YiiM